MYAFERPLLDINRRLGRFRDVIWLLGDARSGTTWAANMINASGCRRELFEPCHPLSTERFTPDMMQRYLRIDDQHPALERFLGDLFEGRISSPRIDRGNRRVSYHGMIVKDVYASLFAHWACQRFPWVKPLLLIRHPFEVARSKLHTRWNYEMDNARLATDQRLIADHFSEQVWMINRVRNTDSDFLNCVLFWAIINRLLIRQFGDTLTVMHYETLREAPLDELERVYGCLNLQEHVDRKRIERTASRLSESSKGANRMQGDNVPISDEEHRLGNEIIQVFELGDYCRPAQ